MCNSEMYDSNSVKAVGECLHSIHLVRGLYPEYIKNSQKLNSKKPNNPIFKNGQILECILYQRRNVCYRGT